MTEAASFSAVPADLASSLADRGFDALTPIQAAVLAAEPGRDLRLLSQTGSGKTVAVGLALTDELAGAHARDHRMGPRALIIAPTRELAAQVGAELTWLYRPRGVRVAVVTGGTGMGGDFRSLRAAPELLVGTPGRLVDHLTRGSLDLSAVTAVVLDEADEMLDMGFRDELERLLDATPGERRTHMVSATMPRDAMALAHRYQRDAVLVAGTQPGRANQDIRHVGHAMRGGDRVAALVNVLLASPGQRTLVFVRTRAAAAEVAGDLASRGFLARGLSGEMNQRERNAALHAFRSGTVDVVVATDVAARGLDIDDVHQVVHFDLPENPEVYTHRSGRTGRAGRAGVSVVFAPPSARRGIERMLRRAGTGIAWRPVPTADDVRAAADARLLAELDQGPATPHTRALAETLLAERDPVELVAQLLARGDHLGPCAAEAIQSVELRNRPGRDSGSDHGRPERARSDHARPARGRAPHGRARGGDYVPFYVTWGAAAGAKPSRLLAQVCRRGRVESGSIGAIKVGPRGSIVEVAADVAASFADAAGQPDPRNPRVAIRPWTERS